MEILNVRDHSLESTVSRAVEMLNSGGLIIYPTDTVYGVAVDATNATAIDRLLSYKRQRDRKPISVAVADRAMAEAYVDLNAQAASLYSSLLPGPYTVISYSKGTVDARCETLHKTLGVRIPDYPLITLLCRELGKPITATAAVTVYKKKPYSVEDVLASLDDVQKNQIALILDAGELPHNDPSTVIDTTIGEVTVLRQGDMKYSSIQTITSNSEAATIEAGFSLMQQYIPYIGTKSVVFALVGEMGAGKTHFTKGIARALGIRQEIGSPTFVLSQEYKGEKGMLFHIDLWRLRDSEELVSLGIFDQLQQGAVFAVEWADRMLDELRVLMHDCIIVYVDIEYSSAMDERIITLRS